ncbi:hypothetical protein N7468_008075 [Penicillium chermesinum]|uniref:COP9 signalosome complex subunit 6 n=1 Tax=Penicillium chermesinum TaxID=63820 RepID=A0A9W9TI40_9EURO|nr:uncharacterized protein N7468_008075 [Penicillium chermesinum]KAJ5223533.1 hypothetical protein N7468_008075 [Penicillium chermesinum]
MDSPRSLVSQKSSDSGLTVQLHPLVLLSISDHITRHAARQQQGPIVGALLGQQNGRQVTLEQVFECPVTETDGEVSVPPVWFEERVQQFKDVHKDPPLDIVGWWSTAPPTGPTPSHLPLHRQILQDYNDSAVFLAFHPSQLQSAESRAAKLPLTIYESVLEGDNAGDTSKDMQIDGEELTSSIRFRELPYTVETGEAEMIGVDTIAKNSHAASWVAPIPKGQSEGQGSDDPSKPQASQPAQLTQEEEERTCAGHSTRLVLTSKSVIGNLNTRINAIRMFQSRISLIKDYILSISGPDAGANSNTAVSHPILRDINALVSNLSLLTPPEDSEFSAEVASQTNDVLLASLLGQMGENVRAIRELGRASAIIQGARQTTASRKNPNAMNTRFEDELFSEHLMQGDGQYSMYS